MMTYFTLKYGFTVNHYSSAPARKVNRTPRHVFESPDFFPFVLYHFKFVYKAFGTKAFFSQAHGFCGPEGNINPPRRHEHFGGGGGGEEGDINNF